VLTVLLLAGFVGRAVAPKAIGVPLSNHAKPEGCLAVMKKPAVAGFFMCKQMQL
jgi:hypothetical protein